MQPRRHCLRSRQLAHISAIAALALAAREQLSAMRFRPAMRLGRPVPQMIVQEFRFVG